MKTWREKDNKRGADKKSSKPMMGERLDALEKLFAIAGDDWERQFKKKRKKEKVKKITSFICPEANTFQYP